MPQPLCVLTPEIGLVSETFIRWDIRELLPDGTVVISDPPPNGQSVQSPAWWDTSACPTLTFEPQPDDPAPPPERIAAMRAFLDSHGVDVVLVEYLDFADRWFDALLDMGVRIWLRGHGVDISARLHEERYRTAYRRYEQADGIIVPSWIAAEALTALGLPPSKIHVIRYSVDIPAQVAPPLPADGPVRCVAVGRMVPKKAPLLVLQAFHEAAQVNPRLVLDLVGTGPLMSEVQNYVTAHSLSERVRLHGPLAHADALALIRSADLLIHHAVTGPDGDTEGQPLVILEAMAAGVPVLGTDHAGIPEVVVDRVNGRVVGEGDVTAMAAALVDLAANPGARRELGAAARRTIEREHNHEYARRTLHGLLGITSPTLLGAATGAGLPAPQATDGPTPRTDHQ